MTSETDLSAPGTSRRLPRAFVFTIAFGSVLQALNASTMAVAMVDIRQDFAAGAAASWLISGLYLATAVGSPTAGRLADRVGPRRVFLISMAITVVTSLVAPLAPNMGWLIAFRMLLGLGTCAAFPSGVAMLRAESDRRGMVLPAGALSALAIAGQVMIAFGPVLGGVLVSWWGWQAIFLVNEDCGDGTAEVTLPYEFLPLLGQLPVQAVDLVLVSAVHEQRHRRCEAEFVPNVAVDAPEALPGEGEGRQPHRALGPVLAGPVPGDVHDPGIVEQRRVERHRLFGVALEHEERRDLLRSGHGCSGVRPLVRRSASHGTPGC